MIVHGQVISFLINHNGLFGHVPLPLATEFELAVALIGIPCIVKLIHWTHIVLLWQPGGVRVRQPLLR